MAETKTTKQSFLTVTLKHPFENGIGEKVTEITLRRPKARDFREIQKEYPGNADLQGFSLAQKLSGLVPEDFDEVDGEDFQAIGTKIAAIVGKSPA